MKNSIEKKAAFTLVELMVTISIIIIIVSASIPALNIFMRGKQLENSARVIQSAIETARRESITKRKNYKVVFCMNKANNPPQGRIKIYDIETGKYTGDVMKLSPGISYRLGFKGSNTEPFDDSNENQSNPSPEAIEGYSIELRRDGSIDFGNYTSVSRALFDSAGADKGDIIILQTGERRRCYIDIDPAAGRTLSKIEKPGK
ncbi:MAG: prepilin-type N-terminal cleavage/methylation domain-containing protein [Planctomycetota bacterium]